MTEPLPLTKSEREEIIGLVNEKYPDRDEVYDAPYVVNRYEATCVALEKALREILDESTHGLPKSGRMAVAEIARKALNPST